MNASEIALVRQSWATVAPDPEQATRAGIVFYTQLFARNPELRALFPRGSLVGQAQKLTQMLAVAIGALDRLDTVAPAVEAMARRHVQYGVRDEHYDAVGAALIDTLAVALGASFTPAVRAAWIDAYGTVAGVMRRAGAAHQRDQYEAECRARFHRIAMGDPAMRAVPTC